MSAKIEYGTPALYFHHAVLTNTGLCREHNEDAYKLPEDTDGAILARNGHLYVLADGMGGHHHGEIASALTIESVNAEYYAANGSLPGHNPEPMIIDALSQAILIANHQIIETTDGGGTTVVAAVLHGDTLVTMNVGDSRAYLLRDDELHLISRDHSWVSMMVEMGKLSPEEALFDPRRNILYQALGQGSELEIHIDREKLKPNDTIILCSDGLWSEIDERVMKDIVSRAPSPQAATEKLIESANAAGGSDNITAIVIQVTDQKLA
jgi:protein phosphatase